MLSLCLYTLYYLMEPYHKLLWMDCEQPLEITVLDVYANKLSNVSITV